MLVASGKMMARSWARALTRSIAVIGMLPALAVACTDASPGGAGSLDAPGTNASGGADGGESVGSAAATGGARPGANEGGRASMAPDDDGPRDDEPRDDEPRSDEPGVVVPVDPDDSEPDEPAPQPDDDEPSREPPAASGLPCEVEALLRTRCQSCHAERPSAGASVPLMDHTDLTAPARSDASLTIAALALSRIKDPHAPMPPAPAGPLDSAEIVALEAWLQAGTPLQTCGHEPTEPSTDPYDAAPTCSSGAYWEGFDSGSRWMMPGVACIDCHRQYPNRAPRFNIAGTVFQTAHEPNKCFGVSAQTGAKIIITDAHGQELAPIPVTSGGNFGAIVSGLALPYRAKVVVGDEERVMLTPQTSGDCNACHTQAGSAGARGRIIIP